MGGEPSTVSNDLDEVRLKKLESLREVLAKAMERADDIVAHSKFIVSTLQGTYDYKFTPEQITGTIASYSGIIANVNRYKEDMNNLNRQIYEMITKRKMNVDINALERGVFLLSNRVMETGRELKIPYRELPKVAESSVNAEESDLSLPMMHPSSNRIMETGQELKIPYRELPKVAESSVNAEESDLSLLLYPSETSSNKRSHQSSQEAIKIEKSHSLSSSSNEEEQSQIPPSHRIDSSELIKPHLKSIVNPQGFKELLRKETAPEATASLRNRRYRKIPVNVADSVNNFEDFREDVSYDDKRKIEEPMTHKSRVISRQSSKIKQDQGVGRVMTNLERVYLNEQPGYQRRRLFNRNSMTPTKKQEESDKLAPSVINLRGNSMGSSCNNNEEKERVNNRRLSRLPFLSQASKRTEKSHKL